MVVFLIQYVLINIVFLRYVVRKNAKPFLPSEFFMVGVLFHQAGIYPNTGHVFYFTDQVGNGLVWIHGYQNMNVIRYGIHNKTSMTILVDNTRYEGMKPIFPIRVYFTVSVLHRKNDLKDDL